jgi:hypothetical protein
MSGERDPVVQGLENATVAFIVLAAIAILVAAFA